MSGLSRRLVLASTTSLGAAVGAPLAGCAAAPATADGTPPASRTGSGGFVNVRPPMLGEHGWFEPFIETQTCKKTLLGNDARGAPF